ncbi:vascular endothelial growth factor receptor 2 isoform X2 [Takifugu flavidus]|uniref:vascular endothelial growth factor receptor 2 isoform X2 n=1 Tax=Takifugu flavidus TaxID=433684 RepID=UPI002544B328|nr:vascular endothelial growth factor receptor 2 isoform X2 [Takifugu flavidus]
MAPAGSLVKLCGIIFEITCVAALELRFMPDPPRLSSYGVHRLNKSDSLELTCRGRQNLQWTTPPTSPRLSISDCRGSGLFCTTLRISNATVNETGLYQCAYKDLKAEDGKTAVSAYVFVRDPKVPFVPSEKEYEMVFVREGEQVVIPCRGSLEDLNVTLHTKYPNKELHPDGKETLWDARKGFTVPSHLISYAGVVFCQTYIGNETYKSPLYIIAVVGYKIYDLTLTPAKTELAAGERLVLSCTATTELNVGIGFNWTRSGQVLTSGNSSSLVSTTSHKKKLWSSLELSNTLIVENVTVDHTGDYTCSASSGPMEKSESAHVTVYEKPFVEIKEPWVKVWEVNVGHQSTTIPVKYSAYPEPGFKWLKNGQPLKDDYRFRQKIDNLVIHRVAETDAGNYTVVLINKITKEEHRRSFQLLVNVAPHIIEKEVAPDTDVYPFGSSPTLRCTARGFPTPSHVEWQWMSKEDCPEAFHSVAIPRSGPVNPDLQLLQCTGWRSISNSTGHRAVERVINDTDHALKKIMSSLKIEKAEVHALYRCLAHNKVGEDSRVIFFHVTRGLEVSVSPSGEPLEEDHVVLRCKADKLLYEDLAWFRVANFTEAEQLSSVQPCRSLVLQETPLTQRLHSNLESANVTLELPMPDASRKDEGLYACQVKNIKTQEKTCLLRRLSLKSLEVAQILNNLTDQRVNLSAIVTLHCDAAGRPSPTVLWTKNNQTVVEGSGVILSHNNRTLTIQRVKKEDSGRYTCTACNRRGCDSSQAFLTTEGAEVKTNVELIVPIGSVVIAMFFWLLIVFVIRGRKKPNGGDMKTGYLSMILDSEDMPMDEQCERLTYDANKWEFPRDRLKLGDPLGRGAFGQVVEAAAFGIEKATTCTTVAVKMLKEGATSSEYRALMSELKILIHIGHHLNVVNLLGACTKAGGPLMVIVEYCKHGNLSSYLKSKRGEYSPYRRKRVDSQKWGSPEEHVIDGDLGLGTVPQLDICTGTALCAMTADKASSSSVDTQEDSSDEDHLTMEDLICYSFQVAKGMEFLSSRKCIHRDLAARNILLSENNVVKICDFGLARDVYKDPDYVRKGDARLPLKWMAPETIFDRVYTTQSDVWSFGVLLWEIFSLGASPYPGVCIDESFCRRLKEGTRMRPPEYAPTEIYQIMLDCWLDRPTDRPTFAELVEHLGNLLQASAQQDGKDYIPLTADADLSPVAPETRSPYNRPQSAELLDVQLHYDSPPPMGASQQSERCSRPLSIKTFEDIPVADSSVMEGHTAIGMCFSPEDEKGLNQHLSATPNFSHLLRCKSKESVASESSNQTSGYQSGYHSDDTDTPIYANEEAIMKHNMLKKPRPHKEASKLLTRLGDSGTTQNIVSTIKGDNTNNSTPEEATLEESFPPTRNVIPGV